MKVDIFVNKTVDENAAMYFDIAKKNKKKILGITKAISDANDKLKSHIDEVSQKESSKFGNSSKIVNRKIEWYEQFRWFFTSSGFLVIGGKDANSNENIIKKYTDKHDLVFHTDMAGSPFMVLKTDGNSPSHLDIEETAQFTACYSKAWKRGLSSAEVFYVDPEQVSKTAKAGEYVSKGSFMIYGKKNYLNPILKLAMANIGGRIECSVSTCLKKRLKKFQSELKPGQEDSSSKLNINNCSCIVEFVSGNEKTSSFAKSIKKIIGGDLDEISRCLPSGGCRFVKNKN
jgi:hypothetical protein